MRAVFAHARPDAKLSHWRSGWGRRECFPNNSVALKHCNSTTEIVARIREWIRTKGVK